MSGKPKHVCFYSKRCKVCEAFLEELLNTPYHKEFQFICVDPDARGNRPRLPGYVRAVPTLLIDGEPDPRVDEQVFNWISLRRIQGNAPAAPAVRTAYVEPPRQEIQSRSEANNVVAPPIYDPSPPKGERPLKFPEPIQTRTQQGQAAPQVQPPSQGNGNEELEAYGGEMSGSGKWSDAYSYIDDQFSIEKGTGGSRIGRNFAGLDGNPISNGVAPQLQVQQRPEAQSEKARALNAAYDNYMKQRDMELPGPIQRR